MAKTKDALTAEDVWEARWKKLMEDYQNSLIYGHSRGSGKTIKIKRFCPPGQWSAEPTVKDRVGRLAEAVAELTKIVVALNKRIDDLENSNR